MILLLRALKANRPVRDIPRDADRKLVKIHTLAPYNRRTSVTKTEMEFEK